MLSDAISNGLKGDERIADLQHQLETAEEGLEHLLEARGMLQDPC